MDLSTEEQEIVDLIKWLHAQPWGTVGGPLHIMTDDQNLEDHWFEEGGFLYQEVEKDIFYYEEDTDVEEAKTKCRRILDLMRPLTYRRRWDVLDVYWGMTTEWCGKCPHPAHGEWSCNDCMCGHSYPEERGWP